MQPRFFSKDKEHANGSTNLADFVPTKEWQTVKEGQILPPGLEIDVNVTTGEKRARLKMGIEEAATVVEESATEAAAGGKDAAKPTPSAATTTSQKERQAHRGYEQGGNGTPTQRGKSTLEASTN